MAHEGTITDRHVHAFVNAALFNVLGASATGRNSSLNALPKDLLEVVSHAQW